MVRLPLGFRARREIAHRDWTIRAQSVMLKRVAEILTDGVGDSGLPGRTCHKTAERIYDTLEAIRISDLNHGSGR